MSDPDTDSYEAFRKDIAKNEISTYARLPITNAFTCRILAYTVLAYRVLAHNGYAGMGAVNDVKAGVLQGLTVAYSDLLQVVPTPDFHKLGLCYYLKILYL